MNQETINKAISDYCESKGCTEVSLRAAMFDMDGVLFDSMKNHAYSWHRTMKHFGFDLPEWEAYMHEGRTGAGTINIVSNRERGHDATEEEINNIYKYKSELFSTCPLAERMPGAYELLLKVKESGVVPMVVTGSGQKSLLDRLNQSFPDVFRKELMVTAFDVKFGKPNPEPYLMGMEKYKAFCNEYKACSTECKAYTNKAKAFSTECKVCCNKTKAFSNELLNANNFIVVENAPLGVQAAVAAGVFTIAVNTGPLPDDALLSQGANLLFHSMQDLCDNWEKLSEALCR